MTTMDIANGHQSAWERLLALAGHQDGQSAPEPSDWYNVNLSTSSDDSDPFDRWRSTVFYDFSADKPEGEKSNFSARAHAIISRRGEFAHSVSSGLSGTQRDMPEAEAGGGLNIGVMLSGRRDYEVGDWRHTARAGELYVYDGGASSRLALSNHQLAYLNISASTLNSVLPSVRPGVEALLDQLRLSPLLPILRLHLAMMEKPANQLELAHPGILLEHAIDLSLFILSTICAASTPSLDRVRAGVVVAAQHVIARHLASPSLNGDFICTRLRISRATLYRAFEGQRYTIAALIRLMRLTSARHRLEQSAYDQAIKDILSDCGIQDAIHFPRQFRDLFGVLPSDIKGIRHSGPGAVGH